MKNVFYLLFIIFSLAFCAQPPTIEKMKQIIPDTVSIVKKGKNANLGPIRKRLESASTKIENSKLTVNFDADHRTIEHQMTIVPDNLQEGYYLSGWSFSTENDGIELISNNCEIQDKSTSKTTNKDCKASQTKDGNKIKFSYKFEMYNTEQLIITYKYKQTPKDKQILYNSQSIVIPLFGGSSNCDYKYIIPDGYVNLGLENNILKKESDKIYTFKGECPSEATNDVIRFSPEEVAWEADEKLNLKSSELFTSDIKMSFPRYYKGGKLKNDNYKITDTNNGIYEESKIIDKEDETKYSIVISKPEKNNIGVHLSSSFTNKLTDDFKVYLPEKYYDLDLTNIPQKIQDEAKKIKDENSDFPDYYNLGKFVHSYMEYDLSYSGKDLTLEEIYNGRKGVCEHYTLLYNAMLNAIGIKTFFVAGWAFDGEETSGDKDTVGHAWTAALIDGKWKELDATWGLFEGIPAGHILKNFGKGKTSYSYSSFSDVKPTFEIIPSIKMVKNSGGNGGNDKTKSDEKDDDDIPVIIPGEGYNLKSSLILLIIIFLF